MTSDNSSQRERVRDLRASLGQRLLILQRAIEARRRGGPDLSAPLMMGGPGKVEMEHVRAVCDTMETEEDRLLAIRTVSTHASMRRAQIAVVLASTLDFLLILFAFSQFARERELRFAVEARAAGPASE